jgi:hypothetical protein
LLEKLATSASDERTRFVANMMLARFAPAQSTRRSALNFLADTEANSPSEVLRADAKEELNSLEKAFREPRFAETNLHNILKVARESVESAKKLQELLSSPVTESNRDEVLRCMSQMTSFKNPILTPSDPRIAVLKQAIDFGDKFDTVHARIRQVATQIALESNAGRLRDLRQYAEMIECLEESTMISQREFDADKSSQKQADLHDRLAVLRDGLTHYAQSCLATDQKTLAAQLFRSALACEERRLDTAYGGSTEMQFLQGILSTLPTEVNKPAKREDKRASLESRERDARILHLMEMVPELSPSFELGLGTVASVEKLVELVTPLIEQKKFDLVHKLLSGYNRVSEGAGYHVPYTKSLFYLYEEATLAAFKAGQLPTLLDIQEERNRWVNRTSEFYSSMHLKDDAADLLRKHALALEDELAAANGLLNSTNQQSDRAVLAQRIQSMKQLQDAYAAGKIPELPALPKLPEMPWRRKLELGFPLTAPQATAAFGEALKRGDKLEIVSAMDRLFEPGMPALGPADDRVKSLENFLRQGTEAPNDSQSVIMQHARTLLARVRCAQSLEQHDLDKAVAEARRIVDEPDKPVADELAARHRLLISALNAKMRHEFFERRNYKSAEAYASEVLELELKCAGGEVTPSVQAAFTNLTSSRLWVIRENFDTLEWEQAEASRKDYQERHLKQFNQVYAKELEAREHSIKERWREAIAGNDGSIEAQKREQQAFNEVLEVLSLRGKYQDMQAAVLTHCEKLQKRKGMDFAGRSPQELILMDLSITAAMLGERDQYALKGVIVAEMAKRILEQTEQYDRDKNAPENWQGIVNTLYLPGLRAGMRGATEADRRTIASVIEKLEKRYPQEQTIP